MVIPWDVYFFSFFLFTFSIKIVSQTNKKLRKYFESYFKQRTVSIFWKILFRLRGREGGGSFFNNKHHKRQDHKTKGLKFL